MGTHVRSKPLLLTPNTHPPFRDVDEIEDGIRTRKGKQCYVSPSAVSSSSDVAVDAMEVQSQLYDVARYAHLFPIMYTMMLMVLSVNTCCKTWLPRTPETVPNVCTERQHSSATEMI